ncbi:hypothetical protein IW261DRAFT_1412978 [Armillaria novae-zelandiae]|uniref:Uncharacterized protein n=1 Tax=Armillaria novae-zelandiae TaxID=153914 RepID=A0AA39PTV4_9AGAR|nr:hypothetical protein IW261DRAFT_1412978 [Armillaria novae-zelandiae]
MVKPIARPVCRRAIGMIESRVKSIIVATKYFYLRVGLQAHDAFFGDIKHIYPRSSNLADQFPAKVLLEAERRYGKFLAWENVDKLSIFSSGWHTSLLNPRYHYTLRGYTKLGWMSATIEMEAANQGVVYTYQLGDWNQWMGSRFQSCQSFNGEMVDGLHKHNPSCSPSSVIVDLTVVQTLSFALSTTFVGGTMPSHDLLLFFQSNLTLIRSWYLSSTNYSKTLEDWLKLQDKNAAGTRHALLLSEADLKSTWRAPNCLIWTTDNILPHGWGVGHYLFRAKNN